MKSTSSLMFVKIGQYPDLLINWRVLEKHKSDVERRVPSALAQYLSFLFLSLQSKCYLSRWLDGFYK